MMHQIAKILHKYFKSSMPPTVPQTGRGPKGDEFTVRDAMKQRRNSMMYDEIPQKFPGGSAPSLFPMHTIINQTSVSIVDTIINEIANLARAGAPCHGNHKINCGRPYSGGNQNELNSKEYLGSVA